MKHECRKVDPNLVHQVCLEDVLICNGYIGLPAIIDKSLFDNEIVEKLNNEELNIFLTLYKEHISDFTKKNKFQDGVYVMKSIFYEIKKNQIEELSKEMVEIISAYYIEYEDKYILNSEFIDENSERLLLNFMDRNDLTISEYDRAKLSHFFEENSVFLKSKIYYSTMFNDANHPYYYKKNHEHVPGIMLIEAVRQALYAYTYTFKKCTRGEVSISMSGLNCNFNEYAQSNYPLKIMVEDNSTDDDMNGRELKLKAKLFQRNKFISEIFFSGSIMNLKVFNRMRLMGKDEESYVFLPIKDNINKLILIDENSFSVYDAHIKEISMKGMSLFIEEDERVINKKFKFILMPKDNNKIIASCSIERKNADDNSFFAGFIDVSKDISMKISDYIKIHTYINEEAAVI